MCSLFLIWRGRVFLKIFTSESIFLWTQGWFHCFYSASKNFSLLKSVRTLTTLWWDFCISFTLIYFLLFCNLNGSYWQNVTINSLFHHFPQLRSIIEQAMSKTCCLMTHSTDYCWGFVVSTKGKEKIKLLETVIYILAHRDMREITMIHFGI